MAEVKKKRIATTVLVMKISEIMLKNQLCSMLPSKLCKLCAIHAESAPMPPKRSQMAPIKTRIVKTKESSETSKTLGESVSPRASAKIFVFEGVFIDLLNHLTINADSTFFHRNFIDEKVAIRLSKCKIFSRS